MRKILFIFSLFSSVSFLFPQPKVSSYSSLETTSGESWRKQVLQKEEKCTEEKKKEEIKYSTYFAYYNYFTLSPIEKTFNEFKKIEEYEEMFNKISPLFFEENFEKNMIFQKLYNFPILRQFGYKTFLTSPTTFTPVENLPVRADYILGPGDEIIINIWGMIEDRYELMINREGSVVIPTIGKVYLQGLTLEQAEKLIKEKFARYYKGFHLSISMGRLKTIKVFVIGEVNKPGGYELPSLATLFTALYAAGGPSKMGSLRNIKLIRDDKVIAVADFYNFLIYGNKKEDKRLFSGDTIFVPPIGDTVAISGNIVKRPGIYEIKKSVSLEELINLAGGTLPFGVNYEVIIESLKKSEKSKKYIFSSIRYNC